MLAIIHLRIISVKIPSKHAAAAFCRYRLIPGKNNVNLESLTRPLLPVLNFAFYNSHRLLITVDIAGIYALKHNLLLCQKLFSPFHCIHFKMQRFPDLNDIKICILFHSPPALLRVAA